MLGQRVTYAMHALYAVSTGTYPGALVFWAADWRSFILEKRKGPIVSHVYPVRMLKIPCNLQPELVEAVQRNKAWSRSLHDPKTVARHHMILL